MSVPQNVIRFEALFYASLFVDVLSAAFDPTTFGEVGDGERAGFMIFAIIFLGAILALVWLAARRAQNWARWALTVLVAMSAWAWLAQVSDTGFGFSTLVDTLSLGLSIAGIWYAFTGDAKDWFRAGPT